jgi:ribulose-5-phosphate 4-epimerase/fuculose-1-phosphate aldolase
MTTSRAASISTASEQKRAREHLAAAYRIAALEGLDDGIWNHFSMAVPGAPGQFYLKPHGLLFSEVRASDLITVGLDGALIAGSGNWEPTAFYIHSRVHAASADAVCVFHTHMPYATALACSKHNRIRAVTQNSMRFIDRVGYFDEYGGLVLGVAEADRMVKALAGHDVLMMASHGVIVTGRTVAEAVYTLHYLEVACKDQVLAAMAAGAAGVRIVPDDVAALAFGQLDRNRLGDSDTHFEAMLRTLERALPGFRD